MLQHSILKICTAHLVECINPYYNRKKSVNTTKYPCTDCDIYRLKYSVGGIGHTGIKNCCFSINFGGIFDFLTFHEVLIY